MTTVTTMAANNMTGMIEVGGEGGGDAARDQLGSLLLEGEGVHFATGGEKGAALFTDRRILIASEAGVFTKRSVVTMVRRAAIDGVTIDSSDKLTVQCSGRGFGSFYLSFDGATAPEGLARWFAEGMAGA